MAGGIVASFFEIVRFLESLMPHQKIFRLLLLVEIKVSNFIRKSLIIESPPPPPTLQV